tara:strand:- start:52 stop:939 length:888 start_codon:yes stop_codon:yes gene_type:complete
MEELKKKFLNLNFEELKTEIMKEENINKMQELLNKIGIKSVKPKVLLSSFVIYFFPEFVLDNLELNEDERILYNNSRDLINYTNIESTIFKSKVLLFAINFEKWREGDRKKFTNNIFHVYHNLTVDSMNSYDDEEKKKQIDVCKNIILECSEKVGGEKLKQQITSYKPVIVDSENLDNNYQEAFWNIIRNDFENNKYSQIITLLKFVKLFIISNKNENTNIFSITRIKEKLENRDCNDDELIILIDKIYDILEKYYEESDSQKISDYKNELWETKDFIDGLKKCTLIIRDILKNQ